MNTHEAWEQIHKTKNWGMYPSEQVIRFVARNYYAKKRHEIKILDYGCGTGSHTWYLAREGFDTYAFDISETAVSKCISRLHEENLSANVETQDGLNLSYPACFFDAVIDNVCIFSNYLADIEKMYQGVYNCLKVGGKLLTIVFSTGTTGFGTGAEVEPGTYEGLEKGCLQGLGHRHFFTEEEIIGLLQRIGFTQIEVDRYYYTDRGNAVEQYHVSCQKEK